jgi:hypothetical protein
MVETGKGSLLIAKLERCQVDYTLDRDRREGTVSAVTSSTDRGPAVDEEIMSDAHRSNAVQLKLADGKLIDITITKGGMNAARQFKTR